MSALEKRAAAYLRKGKIYMHPDSRTTKGFWIACEPILVTSESEKTLGEQVLQVLAKSTDGVPHPETLVNSDSWSVIKALVKEAGVRSYEAFADSAQCVGIELEEADVLFSPTLNGGRGRRFLYLKKEIRCKPVEAEVAAALMEAFAACE
jgi:hypothetical protein